MGESKGSSTTDAAAWVICFFLAILLLWYNCSNGLATGYVAGICQNGLGILDYIGLICCAPLYLLFLILGGASFGMKWW